MEKKFNLSLGTILCMAALMAVGIGMFRVEKAQYPQDACLPQDLRSPMLALAQSSEKELARVLSPVPECDLSMVADTSRQRSIDSLRTLLRWDFFFALLCPAFLALVIRDASPERWKVAVAIGTVQLLADWIENWFLSQKIDGKAEAILWGFAASGVKWIAAAAMLWMLGSLLFWGRRSGACRNWTRLVGTSPEVSGIVGFFLLAGAVAGFLGVAGMTPQIGQHRFTGAGNFEFLGFWYLVLVAVSLWHCAWRVTAALFTDPTV